MASKNFDCYPKIIPKKFVLNVFEACDRGECIVVSTNKRSQAEVFTVYFSLKYLECNNYNVHYALTPLPGVNTPALLYTLH